MMSQIECSSHGVGYRAYVCEHLMSNPAQVWFSEDPTEENQWPDAWCAACEALYQEQGGWSEKNEPKLKVRLVCHRCYHSLRAQFEATQEQE